MIFKNVTIESMGYKIPPVETSSIDIENKLSPLYERLNLPEGRLELMTGIENRYLWEKGFMPSDAAIAAGLDALEKSSINKDDIGCLINCSVCRDFLEPATATVVHHALGLPEEAIVFDISNACLGLLTAIINAANMIELGQVKAAMLVAGENSRSLLESTINAMNSDLTLTRKTIKPYFASLTIGSGAVAFILSKKDNNINKPSLIATSTLSVTKYNDLCRGNADSAMNDANETLMNTDSETLMKHGIQTAKRTWLNFKNETGLQNSDADIFCTHQVGSVHKKLLFEELDLNLEKDYPTLKQFGNTGSVSCPLTIALALESGAFKSGDKLVALGIGSGINCTILGLEW